MKGVFYLLIASFVVGGCSYINRKVGMNDDNLLEEITEEFIKEDLLIDIDLSPTTPEYGPNGKCCRTLFLPIVSSFLFFKRAQC